MGVARLLKPPLRALRGAWRAIRARTTPTSVSPTSPVSPPQTADQGAPAVTPAPPTAPTPAPAPRVVEIDVQETPNPNARKLVCSVSVLPSGTLSFTRPEDADRHPVARALFAVPGVRTVFLASDFVTVTRDPSLGWASLEPAVEAALREALARA